MKRRTLSLVLVLSLIIGLFCVTTVYATSTTAKGNANPATVGEASFKIELTASESTLKAGDEFTVEAKVVDITNAKGLLSVDIPLSFDKAKFELVSYTAKFPAVWGNYGKSFGWEASAATEGFLWLRSVYDGEDFTKGAKADGDISFTLNFKVLETASAGTATIEALNSDSQLFVAAAEATTGKVLYGDGAKLALAIRGDGVVGDVNGDGGIDSLDAAAILQYDAGLKSLDSKQKAAADVNGDGYADALDSARILQYDAGIISKF